MGRLISEKQRLANVRNASLSTGPKTRQGKATSRGNALKHGLTAETLLLPGESAAQFEEFLDAVISRLAPVDVFETQIAERIATLLWRLRRVPAFEAALYKNSEQSNVFSFDNFGLVDHNTGDTSTVSGTIIHNMLQSGLFDKLTRYDAGLQRQLREALKTLEEIQVQRRQSKAADKNNKMKPA